MKIAITSCATTKYMYAMRAQAIRVQSCCLPFKNDELHLILAGENKVEMDKLALFYKQLIPNLTIHLEILDFTDGHENYKPKAQLVIGQLRTAVACKARALDVDYCWSLDSDVLPPPNALKCLIQSLEFDDGFYSIANCPYPSQGGGGFLCGRGTVFRPILPDFYENERKVPPELIVKIDEVKKQMKEIETTHAKAMETGQGDHAKFMADQERIGKELQELGKQVEQCPPEGNVFVVTGKYGYKQRGWFEQAYPGIGLGAVVPIDWCGFGCTLMNRKALALSLFDGYDGGGTEDLYVVWHRWKQNGLRLNAIPHCPADHVIRNPGKEGYYIHMQAYHETVGECVWHLRIRNRAFYDFHAGEQFDEKNNGILVHKKPEPVIPPIDAAKIVADIIEAPKRRK